MKQYILQSMISFFKGVFGLKPFDTIAKKDYIIPEIPKNSKEQLQLESFCRDIVVNHIIPRTFNRCMICDGYGDIVIHKLRRTRHALCEDCFVGTYYDQILKNYQEIANDETSDPRRVDLKCCSTLHGQLRNACKTNFAIGYVEFPESTNEQIIKIKKIASTFKEYEAKRHSINGRYFLCNDATCAHINELNIYETPKGTKLRSCDKCKNVWCGCGAVPFHFGQTCVAYKHMHRQDIDPDMMEKIRAGAIKICPGCDQGVEKNYGCNHMQCGQCKTHFCWVCGEGPIDPGRHFSSRGGCDQFSN